MPESTAQAEQDNQRNWYCLRTQTKREHIAASLLVQNPDIEVFCPRVSLVKKTRTGKKRFVEAMFPGYFFAKFNYAEQQRLVRHSQGVATIVEHGDRRVVPESSILELIEMLPNGTIEVPDPSLEAGAEIEFVAGSLKGLNGKVIAALPATKRLQILLDFLGREITVEVNSDDVLIAKDRT